MNKEKLVKFVYVLLRERLTFGDMESIIQEVESSSTADQIPLVQLYAEETLNRLLKSGLKCYDNMCNTQDDDVKMVSVATEKIQRTGLHWEPVYQRVAMCADCRKRNPQAVVAEN